MPESNAMGWCRIYVCDEQAAQPSEFCSGHQHAANEKPGLVMPAPSPEGEHRKAGGGASRRVVRRDLKWTRETVVAAIREVAEKVGHTPSRGEMNVAGYSSAQASTTRRRLGVSWAELVREAGFEPNTSGTGMARRVLGRAAACPAESEREPKSEDAAGPSEPAIERSVSPRSARAEGGPASRSERLLRAIFEEQA